MDNKALQEELNRTQEELRTLRKEFDRVAAVVWRLAEMATGDRNRSGERVKE